MHSINLAAAWSRFSIMNGCSGWARWFGEPSNVVSPEQVWFVAEGVNQRRFWLNGRRLGEEETSGSPVLVTGRLERRNLLLLLPLEVSAVEVRGLTSALLAGRGQAMRQSRPEELSRVVLLIAENLVDSNLAGDR